MSNINSINEIKDHTNRLKQQIKQIKDADIRKFDGQKFGAEGQYTYKGLLNNLDELLTDVDVFIENPKKFLKISGYADRGDIRKDLLSIVNLSLSDPSGFVKYLELLKTAVRPFHIYYAKEKSLNFEEELLELTDKRQLLIEHLKQAIANNEQLHRMLEDLTVKKQKLEDKLPQLEKNIVNAQYQLKDSERNAQQIGNTKKNVMQHSDTVNNFVNNINERELQLEGQKTETEEYTKKLNTFKQEQKQLSKTVEELIEKAKAALNYGQAQGISAAFQARLKKIEGDGRRLGPKVIRFLWIFSAIAFVVLGIILTVKFIDTNATDFSATLARLSIIALPLAGAWFCAGQYTKSRNIAEDYAYKTVLAQSIIGFSEQLKSDDEKDTSYQDYIKKMLDQLHQHPVSKYKEKDTDNTILKKLVNIVKPTNKKYFDVTITKQKH